jgi:lipoic acid synthetase
MKQERKPGWLKTPLGGTARFAETKHIVNSHGLHTICSSGKCPNRNECWSRGTATFLIGGNICTRSCKFCNTQTGRPLPLDPNEPAQVAESIRLMKLRHAVITSVDRDDLPDMGARHWADTIRAIKQANPHTTLEALIPDFRGCLDKADQIIDASPEVISHNMETVRRLTPHIRSSARYDTSLALLAHIARRGVTAKTGFMAGLGETEDEIYELMDDIAATGVSVLTIGQYLQPSAGNIPVAAYIPPGTFARYREAAAGKGFRFVESGPLVRSSYYAERCLG